MHEPVELPCRRWIVQKVSTRIVSLPRAKPGECWINLKKPKCKSS